MTRLRLGFSRHGLFLAPCALTLALCSWRLAARPLWFDEHASWWAASLPFGALQTLFGNLDLAIAPYYLMLKAWTSLFGDSPAALRLPSALAMGVAAGLIVQLGKKLLDARVGLVAGLVFATVPSVTRFGQEVRVYAFVVVLATLATLLLLRALDTPERRTGWIAYAACIVALGLAHAPSLCLLAAHSVALVDTFGVRPWRMRTRCLAPWSLSVLAALLALAPMLWFASAQTAEIAWNKPDYADLLRYPRRLLLTGKIQPRIVAALGLVALFKPSRGRLMLVCWGLLPPVLFFATRETLHLFLARYLLFTLPAILLLAAAGLVDLAQRVRWPRSVLACSTAALMALGLTAKMRGRLYDSMFDHRGAAASVSSAQKPGDALAFGGTPRARRFGRIALHYELRGRLPRDIFAAPPLPESGNFITGECPAAACLKDDVQRLWLVTSGAADNPWEGLPAERVEALQSQFDLAAYHPHTNANVFLLTRKL